MYIITHYLVFKRNKTKIIHHIHHMVIIISPITTNQNTQNNQENHVNHKMEIKLQTEKTTPTQDN